MPLARNSVLHPNMHKYRKFELTLSHLLILTPWFLFYWSEYEKDFQSHSYWRGFSICWIKNKNISEGGLYFIKEFTYEIDRISARPSMEFDKYLDVIGLR